MVAGIAAVIAVIVALASATGNLPDLVSSVWGTIVDVITGAINIVIDAINVFIGAINKAASLSNSVFHTHFSTKSRPPHR